MIQPLPLINWTDSKRHCLQREPECKWTNLTDDIPYTTCYTVIYGVRKQTTCCSHNIWTEQELMGDANCIHLSIRPPFRRDQEKTVSTSRSSSRTLIDAVGRPNIRPIPRHCCLPTYCITVKPNKDNCQPKLVSGALINCWITIHSVFH